MNSFFELSQSRTWALFALNKLDNIKVYLNVKDVDKTSRWFLQEIPKCYGSISLKDWVSKEEEDYIVFYKSKGKESESLYINLFEDKQDKDRLYTGLYYEYGTRWADVCLVIWNRKHPEVTDQGVAVGRCPEFNNLQKNDFKCVSTE